MLRNNRNITSSGGIKGTLYHIYFLPPKAAIFENQENSHVLW